MIRIVPASLDVALVIVFTIIGRISHAEPINPIGVFTTAWPFVAACVFAWIIVALLAADGLGPRSTLIVWLVTWLGGFGLRLLAGGGAAPPFLLVAAGFLAATLAGWRLIWFLAVSRRRSA